MIPFLQKLFRGEPSPSRTVAGSAAAPAFNPKPYVLLMSGRCGSSMLMAYLNQFEDVICYPELFFERSDEYQKLFLQALVKGEEKALIDERSAIGYNGTSPFAKDPNKLSAVGLKVKYGDIVDLPAFKKFAVENQLTVIYMSRTNILRAALSRYRAMRLHERHGDYNMTSQQQAIGALHMDLVEFLPWVEQEEKYFHDLNDIVGNFGMRVPGVLYENVINDVPGQMNYILEILGSRFRMRYEYDRRRAMPSIYELETRNFVKHLEQRVLKMTDDDFSKVIYNHAEFEEFFRQSKYAEFLSPELEAF